MEDLVSTIEAANEAYYNTGVSIIDDNEYDILLERLRAIDPNHPLLTQIGTEVKGQKVELPYWLGSMDKIKTEKLLTQWLQRNKCHNYIITDKLDGISALYIGGRLYTRGNGSYGHDISHLIPILELPKIPNTYGVRGEIILPKGLISKARNVVSGIVNSKHKEINETLKQNLKFIAYEKIEKKEQSPPDTQLDELKKAKFDTVTSCNLATLNMTLLEEYLINRKQSGQFEIDGLIIQCDTPYLRNTSGNPSYAMAFKVNTSAIVTKVIDVLWSVSKDGLVIPRIHYEPIDWEGVILEYVSGHNAKFIVDNQIGISTIIEIVRSGDVIPYVSSVIQSTTPRLPEGIEYDWDDNHVHFVTRDKNIVKELAYFVKKMEIKFLDEGLLARLVEHGIDTVRKLKNVTTTELIKIEGFKKTLADKIVKQIKEKFENPDLATLLVASNQFGSNIADKKILILIKKWSDLISDYEKGLVTIQSVKELDGFSDILAKQSIDGIVNFIKWMETNGITKYRVEKIETQSGKLSGKTFVFSGFRDASKEKTIEELGGKVLNTISKKTTYLVVKDKSQSTSKIEKAQELGISIITVQELDELI